MLEFIAIEAWLLLTFFICCLHNQSISLHSIVKEYICLKNVIHQTDRNEWLLLSVLRLKTQHLYTKLLCQKPMLRQIEWGIQNEPITKNGVLPVTVFFWKFCFTLRTSYKELIWYFLLSHMFPLQGSSRKGNNADYTPLLLKRNSCQTWLCLVIIYKFLSGGQLLNIL